MTNIELNGQIVRTSRNLRGLLDYARVSKPARVELTPIGARQGRLRVIYSDGAIGQNLFECYGVMVDWVANRRSWRGAELIKY